jgi:hypothetical protein
LTPGTHRITIRVDNRIKDFNVGVNSHSISDHTQGNWNGMIGRLEIRSLPDLALQDIQIFPDINKKQIVARIAVQNNSSLEHANIELSASINKSGAEQLKPLNNKVFLKKGIQVFEIAYTVGHHPFLWDEFQPNLYTLNIKLAGENFKEEKKINFGMRDFSVQGTQFKINDRLIFLRGTLECAIFPKTGYPPTDKNSWTRIFKIAKSYGLNHLRFHSWCPPEAAFAAADETGLYLQIEACSWANQGSSIGDGKPIDKYIYDESERIVKSYGNHPSFCMLAYGNEPAGNNQEKYLAEFVTYWKKKDNRRLYTSGSGWPIIAESDYNSSAEPRIQGWGEELKSIINSKPPASNYDWRNIISKWNHPTISHEIGQWCVYPDFKEIKKYTGVLQAKNFEIFQQKLIDNNLGHLADSFLLASGKLQALCYKADIEAALRTPGFGGFQLLDLHDFPGQGTALVGVLNPFWEDKGYITAKEYSRFCNAVVPLARFSKMIFLNNEDLVLPVEIAQFGERELLNTVPEWDIKNAAGKILFQGKLPKKNIGYGNNILLGEIRQTLSSVNKPSKLVLTVSVDKYSNSWDFFVYPSRHQDLKEDILVTQVLDDKTIEALKNGGKVLLTFKMGSIKKEMGGDIKIGFSSIFWNTAWTGGQAPNTLGILCNPKHPALSEFPTDYYSNWQWWDAMSHSRAIRLDSVAKRLNPIVSVIDDWVSANSLGLVFECKVGKGKLIVSGIDLLTDQDSRPEAGQLLYSLGKYMTSKDFNPKTKVLIDRIEALTIY